MICIHYLLFIIVYFKLSSSNKYIHVNPNYHGPGLCKDFLLLNNLDKCCDDQNNECYMIHYSNMRCFCDSICKIAAGFIGDCCEDAAFACEPTTKTSTTTTTSTQTSTTISILTTFTTQSKEARIINKINSTILTSILLTQTTTSFQITTKNSSLSISQAVFIGNTALFLIIIVFFLILILISFIQKPSKLLSSTNTSQQQDEEQEITTTQENDESQQCINENQSFIKLNNYEPNKDRALTVALYYSSVLKDWLNVNI